MTNNLGIGLGLQATLPNARDLWLQKQQQGRFAMQQAMQMAQQERQTAAQVEAKAYDDFTMNDKYKWHRLLVDEAVKNSKEAVDKLLELKTSGDPNWYNQVNLVRQQYNAKKAELVALNESYMDLDDQSKSLGQGTTYTSRGSEEWLKVFNEARNREDFIRLAKEKGLQSDKYFMFDEEQGYVKYMPDRRIDLQSSINTQAGKVPLVTYNSYTPTAGGGQIKETVRLVPKTIEDAEAAYKANPKDFQFGRPPSLEEEAMRMLSNPSFAQQYADTRGFDVNDSETLLRTLTDELWNVSPYKSSETLHQPKQTNIYNNMGGSDSGLDISNPIPRADVDVNYQPEGPGAKVVRSSQPNFYVYSPKVKVQGTAIQTDMSFLGSPDRPFTTVTLSNDKPTLDRVYIAPYVLNKAGKKVPYDPAYGGTIAGVAAFYNLDTGIGNLIVGDLTKYSIPYTNIEADKELKKLTQATINSVLRKAADAQAKLKTPTDPSGNAAFIQQLEQLTKPQ